MSEPAKKVTDMRKLEPQFTSSDLGCYAAVENKIFQFIWQQVTMQVRSPVARALLGIE